MTRSGTSAGGEKGGRVTVGSLPGDPVGGKDTGLRSEASASGMFAGQEGWRLGPAGSEGRGKCQKW